MAQWAVSLINSNSEVPGFRNFGNDKIVVDNTKTEYIYFATHVWSKWPDWIKSWTSGRDDDNPPESVGPNSADYDITNARTLQAFTEFIQSLKAANSFNNFPIFTDIPRGERGFDDVGNELKYNAILAEADKQFPEDIAKESFKRSFDRTHNDKDVSKCFEDFWQAWKNYENPEGFLRSYMPALINARNQWSMETVRSDSQNFIFGYDKEYIQSIFNTAILEYCGYTKYLAAPPPPPPRSSAPTTRHTAAPAPPLAGRWRGGVHSKNKLRKTKKLSSNKTKKAKRTNKKTKRSR